jgi:hypothetical protein
MFAHWRKRLPPAPVLTRALWCTAGALLLALGSYWFRAEVWPNHPAAGGWSLALLPVLVVAGMLQLMQALYCWLETVPGPNWLHLLLRIGMALAQISTALLLVAVGLGSLIVMAVIL